MNSVSFVLDIRSFLFRKPLFRVPRELNGSFIHQISRSRPFVPPAVNFLCQPILSCILSSIYYLILLRDSQISRVKFSGSTALDPLVMSRFPDIGPVEFEERPPNEKSQDGPDFPIWRRKPMNEVMALYKIQECQTLIGMHRNIQKQFNPLAHSQYWLRELSIQDCETRLAHAQIDLNYCVRRRYIKNSLDTLESYLKGIDVMSSNVHVITNTVLQKACADMQARGPPFREEERERERFKFHSLLRQSYGSPTSVAWCPVTGAYAPQSLLRPTHIFPYWVGEHITKMIFGADFSHETLTTKNGLLVHESVAIALANLWIVIVPVGRARSGRWKTRVIRKDLLNRHIGFYKRTWQSIENQEIAFQGEDRPSARYLYWHYATARIHASARQPANFWTDLIGRDCWIPDEQFMRLDYLKAYIEVRQDFALDKFEDVRKCAIPGWSPSRYLDTKIAAKWMSGVMNREHQLVTWRNAGPPVDEKDGFNGDMSGYGADEEDSERSMMKVNANGKPIHVIGPKVNQPPSEPPYTGPPGLELFETSSEGEREDGREDSNAQPNPTIALEDAENQPSPDALQELFFQPGANSPIDRLNEPNLLRPAGAEAEPERSN